MGELNPNKNHEIVIRAIAKLHNPKIHYVIAGNDVLHDYLSNLAKSCGIVGQVHLLGYRMGIAELYQAQMSAYSHPYARG